MDALVVEALRVGYRIPFDRRPPLSERPLSLPAYSPQSIETEENMVNVKNTGASTFPVKNHGIHYKTPYFML